MSYTFPESLRPLRAYLEKRGCDVHAFATARQAAFMAQSLIGSRVKFPPKGSDMTSTLWLIQEALAGRSPNSTMIERKPVKTSAPKVIAKQALKARSEKTGKSRDWSQKASYLNAFTPDLVNSGVHIFADGAAIPNPGAGGWGFVAYRDGEEIHSDYAGEADTTNNRMEITAVLMAIRWAANVDGPVSIWTDSQYTCNGCNDWRHGWKARGWQRGGPNKDPKNRSLANADLWMAIDEALSGPRAELITVAWVKGHAGHVGNERADELAEIGRQQLSGNSRPLNDDLDAEYRAVMAG